jgi:pimeloyl-ACP methyl ester carboxylesterase
MGALMSSIAFPHVTPTYDINHQYLFFVMRVDNHKIPVKFYKMNTNLPTLLMCHGNSEDIGQKNIIDLAVNFNANICLFDYAGYGLHSCKFSSEYNCNLDVLTVYNYLNNHLKLKNIIICGYSIGTGPACYLAHYLSCRNIFTKLILISSFKSIAKTSCNIPIPGDFFKNYLLAPNITCPTLFIHGCQDKVTDYHSALELSKEFPMLYNFVTIHGCGHHKIQLHKTYIEAINNFSKIK